MFMAYLALLTAVLSPPQHPTLGLDLQKPVLDRRDSSQVLQDMLLADEPDRKNSAGGERDRRAEEPLQHEDALRVVPQGPVSEVGEVLFAAVEELV